MGEKSNGFPVIRWHQTADVGYVPNDKMPNTFMAVAMDTWQEQLNELQGGVHPMNKQTPSLRLAYAGINMAYGYHKYPTQGPWPTSINLESESILIYLFWIHIFEIFAENDNMSAISLTYDQSISFNNTDWQL